jgi:Leucine-rich repeat (LRR) protein
MMKSLRAYVRTGTMLFLLLGFSAPTTAQIFNDVPPGYFAESFIQILAQSGVTTGCGNGNFCPEDPVTRAQMAVFLERGMNGATFVPPPATGTVFGDVGASDFAANFIEQLFADGITGGCGSGNYCPNDSVTRAQMAVFLLRAINGAGYVPPPPTGIFGDVPVGAFAANFIEQLAAVGITSGCGGGNYCPNDPVTRAQMAVFLVRAFNLDQPQDTTAPAARLINPLDGGTFVDLNVLVAAEFNEDVNNVDGTSFTLSRNSTVVDSTVLFLDGIDWVKLSSNKTLALLSEYTITANDTITDLADNPLAETTWSFTTTDGEWLSSEKAVDAFGDGRARDSRLAVSSSGNAIVVWEEFDDTLNVASIWANHYEPGRGWGIPELVEADDAFGAGNPKVAMDDAGNAIVVWERGDGFFASSVWANRYSAVSGWGVPEALESDAGGAVFVEVAVNAAGNAVAVWQQRDGSGVENIRANRYTPGAGWSGPEAVESDTVNFAFRPQVGINDAGVIFVVWEQEDDTPDFISHIWANRYLPGGGWQAPGLVETNAAEYAFTPEVVVDANGDATAVWVQEDLTEDFFLHIWANRFTASGAASWGTPERLETDEFSNADKPQLAIDSGGNVIAVWQQTDENLISGNTGRPISNAWANRYISGTGWTGEFLLESNNVNDAFRPDVAVDMAGNAIAVWESRSVVENTISAVRFTPGGGVQIPTTIGDFNAHEPQVAADGFGNMIVTWDRDPVDGQEIFFNRLGGGGEPGGQLITDIVFSDPALGACVRAAAEANFWHFSQEVRSLDCSNRAITSLGGLLTFTNIETLDLSGNAFSETGMFARFEDLQSLNLSNIPTITDISSLGGLGQLTQLDLSGSGDGLIACSALDELTSNGVTVTSPVTCRQRITDVAFGNAVLQTCALDSARRERATYVDELSFLDCNRENGLGIINDLSGVEVFENLEAVNFDRHDILDLAPLAGLAGLKRVDVSSTFVSNLAPLATAPALEVLVLRSIPRLYNDDPSIGEDPTGISLLASMPALKEAYLDQKEYCPLGTFCTTGGGRMDCATLDALETQLDIFVRPRMCNMPVANVTFADANLAACVADATAMMVNPGTFDVTRLSCDSRGITSLEGLQRFSRLEYLAVNFNPVQDLSPLNEIALLQELNVIDTAITDFYGLSNLEFIHTLRAADSAGLVDIRELITMPRLTNVRLDNAGDGSITCEEVDLLADIVTQPPHFNYPGNLPIPIFVEPACDAAGQIDRPVRSTDVNADGRDDLVLEYAPTDDTLFTSNWAVASSNGIGFNIGGAIAGFPAATYSRARAVALGDANGDDNDDLLLQLDSATDDTVHWFVRLSDGAGGWGALLGPASMPDGIIDNARAVAFNDVDGDGNADILIERQVSTGLGTTNERTFVEYHLSMGTGTGYSPPSQIIDGIFVEALGRPHIVALEDVNTDGFADLVLDRQQIVGDKNPELKHCFIVRHYQPGIGFDPGISGIIDCYELSIDARVRIDLSVADIDGNGFKELVLAFRNTGGPGFGDLSAGHNVLYLAEGPFGLVWDYLTPLDAAESTIGLTDKPEFRSVAVADFNNDLRADMLLEVTREDGSKSWIAYIATVDSGNGSVIYSRQTNWVPFLGLSSQYRALGVRDYNGDTLPDLIMARVDPNAGTTALYVALNNGAGFSTPTVWHQDTVSAGVVGLEEDGLTTLANDTSELIAWVGDTRLRTFRSFSLKLQIERGWDLIRGPDLDPSIPVPPNKCVMTYADANAGIDNSDPAMVEARAEARFGLMACNITALDGRVELKVQGVYGGCSAAATTTGLGGAKCEAGTFSAELKLDMTPPGSPVPVEADLEAKGPNAAACAAVSLDNLCLNADATLAETSGKVEVGGIGAGAGVGIGLGAKGEVLIEDGVISANIGGKLGVGAEINVSIDVGQTAKTFVETGEAAFTFGEDAGRFIVFTAGPAVFDAAEDAGGAVLDEAGNAAKVVKTGAGVAVYFVAGETGRQSFIVFTEVAGAVIDDVFNGLEAAASDAGAATYGAAISLGTGIADGASAIWDWLF